jgi:2-methylcitrate dehydratase
MKLGAGLVASAVATGTVAAQEGVSPLAGAQALRPRTGPGYKNDFKRLGGNGPMDDTTRKIVRFVAEFSDASLTPNVAKVLNRTMIDSAASIIAGFEEEHARIAARLAKLSPPGELKCTVLGYGIPTTPELGAFANGCLIRATDFNDNAPGGHNSDLIPAALAIGEAVHSTGAEMLAAIVMGYELKGRSPAGESGSAAMVAGKLMKLDEDRLANALSMAITPHVALNKGVGAMSMWKGVRSAEATKNGVWAALLARAGMTGPPQPFEGRGGMWYSRGALGRDFTLPGSPLSIELAWNKRFPSDAQSQGALVLVPEMRQWTTVDDIASVEYDLTFGNWEEVADAPKWDPQNRETADHSMPYLLARALMDGDIYLDSFEPAKFRDPAVRQLMNKMTFGPVAGWEGLGTARITIRKTNGQTRSWDTLGGSRTPGLREYSALMSDDDIARKYERVCAFKKVTNIQRDQARAIWSDLRAVKDIGEAVRALATFGRAVAL